MNSHKYIFYAILAAVLYAVSTPISKLLLNHLSPVYIAALLYLGAGIGMSFVAVIRKRVSNTIYKSFTRKELPSIFGMIILDIIAPILLMVGLNTSHPENVALLNNFEIVATSLFAAFIFREVIPNRLRLAIVLVTIASLLLSFEDIDAFKFSIGSVFVMFATICWGLENNLTRKLSFNDPLMVVVIKGIFSGLGSLTIALLLNEVVLYVSFILWALLLGFIAYGLSIFFYVTAQRELGAARTSTFYSFAPFIGSILSLIIFFELPKVNFYIAIILMAIGSYYASTKSKKHTLDII
ncbi:MAG: DMT family transporter [Candidatus Izemoplasmatales bacterium]|nr:DMT family transporter [Candidatus Izemoplasmatales bacterium]